MYIVFRGEIFGFSQYQAQKIEDKTIEWLKQNTHISNRLESERFRIDTFKVFTSSGMRRQIYIYATKNAKRDLASIIVGIILRLNISTAELDVIVRESRTGEILSLFSSQVEAAGP